MRGAVLFDLDETLIDRRAGLLRFAATLWSEGAVRAESESAFLQSFIALDDLGRTSRRELFTALCARHSPHVDAESLTARFLAEAWREPTLFADALPVLQTLEARGWRIGIVSNGSSLTQRAKINNTALKAWAESVVISEEFGSKKPERAIYEYALAQLGVTARETWFVGDCPVNDVIGPTALGIRSIWVERHTYWPEKYDRIYAARVTSLSEVPGVIV